jgi:hypothetical protein
VRSDSWSAATRRMGGAKRNPSFFSRLGAKAMGCASLHQSYAMAVFCQALAKLFLMFINHSLALKKDVLISISGTISRHISYYETIGSDSAAGRGPPVEATALPGIKNTSSPAPLDHSPKAPPAGEPVTRLSAYPLPLPLLNPPPEETAMLSKPSLPPPPHATDCFAATTSSHRTCRSWTRRCTSLCSNQWCNFPR